MQILLPLQSIKTCSGERGFFLADAPSEGAETKLWHPDALKALGSLGSYELLLDLEVFIESRYVRNTTVNVIRSVC